VASGLYALPLKNNLTQTTNFEIDFDDTTAGRFKCMLVESSYTPNFATDSVKADVSGEVSAGVGYVAGGEALTGVTFAISGGAAAAIITWDAADVTWAASTITNAAAAVIYNTSEPGEPLIAYVDFGGNFSTTSGTFQIVWNASGIFTLDVTP
tara:strand:- start:669 stop:1127 length:459 start_codon:yes stop_codon:yes gene_type:complete